MLKWLYRVRLLIEMQKLKGLLKSFGAPCVLHDMELLEDEMPEVHRESLGSSQYIRPDNRAVNWPYRVRWAHLHVQQAVAIPLTMREVDVIVIMRAGDITCLCIVWKTRGKEESISMEPGGWTKHVRGRISSYSDP